MSGEAFYLLSSLLLSYLIYILVTRGRRSWIGYLWRRWRVAVDVWLVRVGAAVSGGSGSGGGGGDVDLLSVVEPSAWEVEVEQPKPFITDRHEDVISVSGVDKEGRAVVLRAARLSNRRASVFLTVIDKDGTVYTLPNQPDTSQVNVEGEGWGGAGLSVTCVDPMRLWRVKFSGLLRRGAKAEYITEGSEEETKERTAKRQQRRMTKTKTDFKEEEKAKQEDTKQKEGQEEDDEDEDDEDDEDIVHARFDFLWRSLRGPVEFSASISPLLLSRALAPHLNASPWDFMEEEREGYEQWGCLHGTIRLAGDAPLDTWYLRGPRRHRWGLPRAVGLGLTTSVCFTNGDQFSLRARCIAPSGPQYMSGYLHTSSGRLHVLTSCDLDLNMLNKLDVLGHNLLIKFTAGGRNYEVWQQLGESGVKYHTGDPWTLGHTLYHAPAAATHSHGRAITTLTRRYTELCPVPERESLPVVEAPVGWAMDGVPLVVPLEDPCCRDPSLAGGKGASLAMLTAYRELLEPEQEPYEVPPGVVVTARAWEVQLEACPELQQAIRNLRLASAAGQPARLKEACARAVEVCKGVQVCAAVKKELLEALAEMLDVETTRLAVRSSGCSEDGAESSAAGQNETVLGVAGQRNLLAALTRCWASLYTYHSVEYRRQRGQPVECGMAVVVQEMAAAVAAGVIFTVDPITGDPSAITITANYGLGESVVSGGSEPDTVVVRRSWRDALRIVKRSVGGKASMCVLKEGGGTQEVAVGVEEQKQTCISDAAALRLARVALFLHEAFAGPRDIEFALLKGGQVVVLQARPVTTLNAWTEYELIHEQDNGTLTDHEPVTKGNTGEVFPGSTSPLSLCVIVGSLDLTFQLQWWDSLDIHHVRLSPSYYTHVFINMQEVMFRLAEEEAAGMLVYQALDMAVFGHLVSSVEMLRRARERWGVATLWEKSYSLLRIIYDKVRLSRRAMKRYQDKYKDYQVGEGRAVSASDLYTEITRRFSDLQEICNIHVCTSRFSSTTQTIAFVLLAEGKKELSKENVLDMAALLSSCTGVESADVPNALKELSRVISENEEAEEFLAMSADEARVWLQSHPGPVGCGFRHFLAKHGHRSIKEFDLRSDSWRLDPHSLVSTLQVMARHPAGKAPEADAPVDLDHILEHLKSPITRSTRRSLSFLLPQCREGVVLREASKSILMKVVDGLRGGYRELGTLLVSEGRLPDPDLVFYLKHTELGQLVEAPSPALVTKAAAKKRLFAHLDNLTFPELNFGVPVPIREEDDQDSEGRRHEGGVVLQGTTVCQGMVKATARVVTRIADADSIQTGDILVTVSTDIGWSPYFTLLNGVVTELGGLMSHGAVVAREYGLPCLVGVVGATSSLRSGDQVLLDSTSGTLTLLQPSPSTSS